MNARLPLLAVDIGTVMFFAFAAISFISWIMNQANAAKKPPQPRRPNAPGQPQRNPQVQREIERFLREASAKQRGPLVSADDIEVVEPARRPPPKRKIVEKPRPAGMPMPSQSGAAARPAPVRPGEQFASRHLAPAPPSVVAAEHLAKSRAAVQLPDDVSKSVSAHLGSFAAASRTEPPHRARPTPFLTELRTPRGMRSAIVLQEILQRPRSVRRNRRTASR